MSATAHLLSHGDLVAITSDVWAAFLLADGVDAPAGTAPPVDRGPAVHATVEVTGAWSGRVSLALSAEAAALATRTMLGAPEVAAADVADAVGELANMVGGNVKSLVPAPSTLGLPVVGDRAVVARPGETEVCRADLAWAGHVVTVVVRSSPPH